MPNKFKKNLYFGMDSEGKEIRKTIRAASKSDLERKIFEAKKEFEQNFNPVKVSWGVYSQDWVKTYKSIKEQSTYDMYPTALNKLSDIDHIPVHDLRTDDFPKCINQYKHFPTACSRVKLAVNQIMDKAIKEGIIRAEKNPALDVEYPKITHQNSRIRVLTEEEKNVTSRNKKIRK